MRAHGQLGTYLIRIRIDRGMTISELSRRSGISHPYLSQLENGRIATPSPHVLRKIADALQVPYLDLLVEAGYLTRAEAAPLSGLPPEVLELLTNPSVRELLRDPLVIEMLQRLAQISQSRGLLPAKPFPKEVKYATE